MAVEIETGYISLLASGRDLRASIVKALQDSGLDQEAKKAGETLSEGIADGVEDGVGKAAQKAGKAAKQGMKKPAAEAGKTASEQMQKPATKAGKGFVRRFSGGLKGIGGAATKAAKEFNAKMGARLSAGAKSMAANVFNPITIGAAAIGTGALFKSAISEASDFAEAANKIGAVFGDAGGLVQDFAKTAAVNFGQSTNEALDAAATFGVFGKSAGLAGEDLAKFSTDFVGLASDMASFHNTSPEQAIEAIGAALRGEAEPMRAYGVLMDDATMRAEALKLGLIQTTKQALTPQQKVLAAQALIYSQTTDAQGDFANTSGELANAQRIATARFADARKVLGTELLPIAKAFFTGLNNVGIPALEGVAKGFGASIRWMGEHKDLLQSVAIGVGVAATAYGAWTLATNAQKIATGIMTGVQWGLNAALNANPLGIVLIAITALTAGVVLAYKKSDTFRRIVDNALRVVGNAATWLWKNIFRPYFTAMGKVITWLWRNIARPYLKLVGFQLKVLGGVVRWIWALVFKPYFTMMGKIVMVTWRNAIKPSLSFIGSGINKLAKATRGGINAIGRHWESLKAKTAGPARWIINRVINPLIRQYNKLAGIFGQRKISQLSFGYGGGSAPSGRSFSGGLRAYASGGFVGGYSPHDKADNILARLTAGEFVLPVKATAALTAKIGPDGLEQLRRGIVPTHGDPVAAYAAGGIVRAQRWMRAQAGKPYIWGGVGPRGYDCSGFASASINAVRGQNPYRRLYATGQTPAGFKRGPGLITIGIDRPGEKRAIGHTAINVAGLKGESRGGGAGVLVGGRARDVRSFNHLYHMGPGGGIFGKLAGMLDMFTSPRKFLMGKVGGAITRLSGSPFAELLKSMSQQIVADMTQFIKSTSGFADGGEVKPVKPMLYDQGGYLPPGISLVENRTGKPERVIAPHQETPGVVINVDKVVGANEREIAEELGRIVERAKTLAGV